MIVPFSKSALLPIYKKLQNLRWDIGGYALKVMPQSGAFLKRSFCLYHSISFCSLGARGGNKQSHDDGGKEKINYLIYPPTQPPCFSFPTPCTPLTFPSAPSSSSLFLLYIPSLSTACSPFPVPSFSLSPYSSPISYSQPLFCSFFLLRVIKTFFGPITWRANESYLLQRV